MAEAADLRKIQYDFAAYLRDPDNVPAPTDIEPRRMAIYRDLFFNNVRKLLAGTFPVLCDLLGEERWALLIRDFYRDHKSRSPLFPDLPREFLHYLAEERLPENSSDEHPDPPFMYELAHYEWVEAGLMLAQDQTPEAVIDGDLLDGLPVVSTVAWLLAYDWPVNKIGSSWQPTEPAEQPLYYLVYRNADEEIIFVTLNAVSARLFEILNQDKPATGREALTQLATELQHPDADKVVTSGTAILEEWRSRGIIAGTAAA
jgi:hypothetical protein